MSGNLEYAVVGLVLHVDIHGVDLCLEGYRFFFLVPFMEVMKGWGERG